MVITFHSDVWFRRINIQTLEIEQRNLSRNSNGHNFSHGCPIPAHNMSRRSKLNNESSREIQMVITFQSDVRFRRINIQTVEIEQRKLSRNSNGHNFSHGCPIRTHNMSSRSKLNNESSREIQMVITFNSDVRFRRINIQTLKIEQLKLSRNSNGHNFSHGCPIRAHNMPRRSKFNNESSREIQMVITFHSDVRFRRINIETLEIKQRKL